MPINIPFSSTPTFTWDRGDPRTFILTLLGNVISSVFDMTVNPPANTQFVFIIIQDATGNRTFVWPTICKGAPVIGATPLQTTIQEYVLVDGPFLVPVGPPMYV